MKIKFIIIIIGIIIYFISCQSITSIFNKKNNSDQVNKLKDNPELLANLILDISQIDSSSNKELTKLFKKYNFSLTEGVNQLLITYKKIKNNEKNYKIFSNQLLKLIRKKTLN